ncbi:MAG: selenide, water dikinase SelD [Clostridia bacterium]|nr:selenide, water dikinase SelD [Clostridia bacterium]
MNGQDFTKLTGLTGCAGCGAKLGAGVLAEVLAGITQNSDPNLLVGFEKSDDAAVYKISEELALVQTLDFFPAIVDDAYTFGKIAAANALSDVYAMGGEPKICLNIMEVPEKMPRDVIGEILRGGSEKVKEAGAVIAGGHTIFDEVPKYGLSVTGFVNPSKIYKNQGAKPGDVLILTKPLGIGVVTTAGKAGLAGKEAAETALESMQTLNKYARDVFVNCEVHACTDVTGFSLMGHLSEMLAEGIGADVFTQNIKLVPQALEFAEMGLLPEGMYRNRKAYGKNVDESAASEAMADLMFDPQTSGGLLAAVAPEDADECLAALEKCCIAPRKIGTICERKDEKPIKLL